MNAIIRMDAPTGSALACGGRLCGAFAVENTDAPRRFLTSGALSIYCHPLPATLCPWGSDRPIAVD